MRAWMWALVLGLVATAAIGWRSGAVMDLLGRVPPAWNPWAPLRIDDPPGLLTRWKLTQLQNDPVRCQAVLATGNYRYQLLDDRETGPGCGFFNAVRISGLATVEVSADFSLSCRTAVALALWERHVLQPAAIRFFGEPVSHLDHFGSYACRNLYNRSSGRRSSHATADALDVAGFRWRDGRRVRVVTDWNDATTAESGFLRTVRDGACRFFGTVLGPDYNAAHRDHFHFEASGFGRCR